MPQEILLCIFSISNKKPFSSASGACSYCPLQQKVGEGDFVYFFFECSFTSRSGWHNSLLPVRGAISLPAVQPVPISSPAWPFAKLIDLTKKTAWHLGGVMVLRWISSSGASLVSSRGSTGCPAIAASDSHLLDTLSVLNVLICGKWAL